MTTLKMARPVALLKAGRTDWYRIKNLAPGVTGIYIYDEIGYFGVTAQDFINELQTVNTSAIELHLNTPGGDVFDGIAILNALRDHPATVNVQVDSLAASIGSVIAMAGDKVTMARNSTMMIHEASGLAIGNAQDMRELADLLDQTSDNIASIYADRAGGSVDVWRAAMRAETWYSAQEAVDAGLADEVKSGTSPTDDGPANSWDLSIFQYSGRDKALGPKPVENAAPNDEDDYLAAACTALQEVFSA